MNKNQSEGSVFFLDNPGNISIIDSVFENNLGVTGACIFYSELSKFFKY